MLTSTMSTTLEPIMQSTTCPTTIQLSRPLQDRLLERASDAFEALRKAWQRHAERRRVERELEAVADMNEVLLRDIGAPEWMISQATARREFDRQRLLEVELGARFDH
jgi:hypothetical protein